MKAQVVALILLLLVTHSQVNAADLTQFYHQVHSIELAISGTERDVMKLSQEFEEFIPASQSFSQRLRRAKNHLNHYKKRIEDEINLKKMKEAEIIRLERGFEQTRSIAIQRLLKIKKNEFKKFKRNSNKNIRALYREMFGKVYTLDDSFLFITHKGINPLLVVGIFGIASLATAGLSFIFGGLPYLMYMAAGTLLFPSGVWFGALGALFGGGLLAGLGAGTGSFENSSIVRMNGAKKYLLLSGEQIHEIQKRSKEKMYEMCDDPLCAVVSHKVYVEWHEKMNGLDKKIKILNNDLRISKYKLVRNRKLKRSLKKLTKEYLKELAND